MTRHPSSVSPTCFILVGWTEGGCPFPYDAMNKEFLITVLSERDLYTPQELFSCNVGYIPYLLMLPHPSAAIIDLRC